MKIITKILSVVAVIIGLMAVVVGTRVLFGVFDPGYQYYTSLISYNIILGIVSIITAFLIWKRNGKALLFSGIITGLHFSVLISLLTIFSDIISDHSVKAMTFRFVIWLVITIVLWKLNPKLKDV